MCLFFFLFYCYGKICLKEISWVETRRPCLNCKKKTSRRWVILLSCGVSVKTSQLRSFGADRKANEMIHIWTGEHSVYPLWDVMVQGMLEWSANVRWAVKAAMYSVLRWAFVAILVLNTQYNNIIWNNSHYTQWNNKAVRFSVMMKQ